MIAAIPSIHRSQRIRFATGLLSVALFVMAIFALHRLLAEFNFSSFVAELAQTRSKRIAGAAVAALCSYLLLIGFDVAGLRMIDKRLPLRVVARTALIANALGHNLGLAALTGGAARMRSYARFGLDPVQVGHVVAANSLGFVLGALFWLGVALISQSRRAETVLQVPAPVLAGVGASVLLGLVAVLIWMGRNRRQYVLFGKTLLLPDGRTGLTLSAISIVELAAAAATLYLLLPTPADTGFIDFVGLYVAAVFAGLISTVPGGLGIFETVILVLLPGMPPHQALAALLLYRTVYYLLPLILALVALGVGMARLPATALRLRLGRAAQLGAPMAVPALALLVFWAGAALLVSGSLPLSRETFDTIIPLPLLELSHLTASILGVALVVLARGLSQRIDLAWALSLISLVLGAGVVLISGFRWPMALALLAVAGLVFSVRHRFYRHAALLDLGALHWAWWRNIALVLTSALWLGLLAYRHVDYRHELWWQFAVDADAPRMLRASLVSMLALLAIGLTGLLRPNAPRAVAAGLLQRNRAAELIAHIGRVESNLALLPDKQLLFATPPAEGLLMYQRSGPCLIALGDPVGVDSVVDELAWEFRELADHARCWPVFYQVGADRLPLYLELGLSLTKLGEEALVPLAGFSLAGPRRADLRQEHRRAVRAGAEFSVVDCTQVPDLLPQLREVSDAWLRSRKTAEKGFSLGYFDAEYLGHFSCALVRVKGRIVAFANIWTGSDRGSLSVDLMRHADDAAKSTMDFLFVETMLWGRDQGFREFSLGMAPLAGLSRHQLAPLWHKFGSMVSAHGAGLYNFQGLMHYKTKFDPQWRPRYLASPGGIRLPQVLFHVSRLIAGGTRRMFRR